MKVREKLPSRRAIPTETPSGKNWSQHKPDLKEDFHSHCGYCGSFDGFRHTYFEVDHFIPKSLFEKNENIQYCQYDNLVYSCKFCNGKKSAIWPSGNENISVIDNQGFIDPCKTEYDAHIHRTDDGGIMWDTQLGEWLVKEAFKFDERDASIKLLWELNKSRKFFNVLIFELKKHAPSSANYSKIKQKAEKLSFQYVLMHNELMDYYNNI